MSYYEGNAGKYRIKKEYREQFGYLFDEDYEKLESVPMLKYLEECSQIHRAPRGGTLQFLNDDYTEGWDRYKTKYDKDTGIFTFRYSYNARGDYMDFISAFNEMLEEISDEIEIAGWSEDNWYSSNGNWQQITWSHTHALDSDFPNIYLWHGKDGLILGKSEYRYGGLTVEKIYFDMDGVLADFWNGVRELCGLEPPDQNNPGKDKKSSDEKMFNSIKSVDNFYLKLKPIEEGVRLFMNLQKSYGKDKVAILTGIPKPERGIIQASDDKKEWVRKYLGKDVEVNTVLAREKKNYCKGFGYMLIDDYKKNIDEWENVGGIGYRFNMDEGETYLTYSVTTAQRINPGNEAILLGGIIDLPLKQ